MYICTVEYYLKSIKTTHNGTLTLNKNKIEDSKNHLIYANIDNCEDHESKSRCELILKTCNDPEGN